MVFTEICSVKINLTLRVLGKRDDGYHEIHSLFWRKSSPEVLDIVPSSADSITVIGADIPGENILERTCRYLRSRYGDDALKPIDIKLYKHLPMGSGIGAGSGNAAALLRWFARTTGHTLDICDLASLGADVAFLAGSHDLASASGIGEVLTGIDVKPELSAVILFPDWTVNTAKAYRDIDEIRCHNKSKCDIINAERVGEESREVLDRLLKGSRIGLLPNDFIDCMHEFTPRYEELYGAADRTGALGWGLCGSGSACFALFDNKTPGAITEFMNIISRDYSRLLPWLNKTLVLE